MNKYLVAGFYVETRDVQSEVVNASDALEAVQIVSDELPKWMFVACFYGDAEPVGSWQTFPDEPITLKRAELADGQDDFTVLGFEAPAGEAKVAAVKARHWTLAVKEIRDYFAARNRPFKFVMCLKGFHKPLLQYQTMARAAEPGLYAEAPVYAPGLAATKTPGVL